MKKLFHILDLDKRKRKRVELFSNLPGELSTLGRKTNIQIKDVSYGGIGVVLPSDHEFEIIESMEAQVEIFGQVFRGNIANQILLSSEQKKVGFKLPEEGSSQISFSTQDPTWDRVADPETVSSIYQDLILKGYQSPMEIRQNFSRAIVYPRQMLESGAMICEIKEVYQGSLERGRVQCMFELFQTHHAFEGNLERVDATQAQIRLPVVLARLLRRETVRIPKKQAKYDVKLKLSSQAFATKIESYEVFDYSEHGISILDPKGELSLPRNLVFNQAKIEIEGMEEIQGKAEVRSYQWKRDLNAYVVGLKFEPDGEPYLTRWHNLVLKARYPSLDFDYQEKDHQKIWELFERSGYFEFKEEDAFTDMIDLTTQSWKKLSEAGTQFSKKAMIRMDNKIVGHIQMDRIYDKTWCLHHLALDPTIRITVARNLLALTPDVLISEGGEFVINFTDSENTWNKKSYYDFIKNYKEQHHNSLREFITYDIDTQKDRIDLKNMEDIEIKLANKYDLKRILKDIHLRYSQTEINACDYQSDPYLENISAHLEKYGLNRKREYLVAYKNNVFLGYSILESGTEGINIVGVTNLCYINIVQNFDLDFYNKVYESLMLNSFEYYKNKSIRYMLFQLEDPRKDFKVNGLRFMCKTSRWIAVKAVFSRFSAYTNLLYGHLASRREMLRNRISERSKES